MKKKLVPLLAGLVAVVAGAAWAQSRTVHVYNWTDYIGETTLADFTKATGIQTKYDVYTDLETLEAKLLTGNSGYDVIVPTAQPTLRKFIQAQAVQKLDKSKIPNLKNLDPVLMSRLAEVDPGNEYAAIYQWGTVGIGYNPDKVKAALGTATIDSWKQVFDPENAKKLASCGIVVLDSPADILPSVLNYLGLPPSSEKSDDVKKAGELMSSIRPYIKTFVPSVIDPLASGDACVAIGYSGDVLQAQARSGGKVKIDYAIPKEGAQLWFDTLAIPAGAPNVAEAYAYINYMLDPKVMAGISNAVSYANAVPASLPLLKPEIKDNPRIYPPKEVMDKLFTIKQLAQRAEQERNRTWTRIKTGR
ncbi:polyamine ABC transporter substrate-binding protein [Nitrospirillum pindoramense]|uniref:Putrescine-binding periplasmic protein n=1 Tax=Nitrospirillum amazonense TaxID=28077 RepID=A0A560HEX8_9PROT|nr:polyamine ABC transporter substrate-binding protein [Nitrospirillum amazonense]TWB44199.1 putrescine transport system substrate-binding protein [Nitrospirillum amazonense]